MEYGIISTIYKIPPNLPFSKGGIIPLFGKEGGGEISKIMVVQLRNSNYILDCL
jgi:hypothetical protein